VRTLLDDANAVAAQATLGLQRLGFAALGFTVEQVDEFFTERQGFRKRGPAEHCEAKWSQASAEFWGSAARFNSNTE
jgi:hypothetical protein